MIYTYLITASCDRIADIKRIRPISTFVHSETKARQLLAGLPLVFLSCSPAKAVASMSKREKSAALRTKNDATSLIAGLITLAASQNPSIELLKQTRLKINQMATETTELLESLEPEVMMS